MTKSDYVTAIISSLALVVSVYAVWFSRREPVRDSQSKIRKALKDTLHSLDFYRLDKAISTLGNTIPSSRYKEELLGIKQYLEMSMNEFIAPTPKQLKAFVGTIDKTLADWDKATGTPQTDAILRADGDKPSRELLQRDFELLRRDIRCIVDGINKINKSALVVGGQKRVFKELER
jgi:hypothetical protein